MSSVMANLFADELKEGWVVSGYSVVPQGRETVHHVLISRFGELKTGRFTLDEFGSVSDFEELELVSGS